MLSASFLLTTFLGMASPPNVPPPMRLLVCVLAAVTSAVTEVVTLNVVQEFGRSSLQGWGVGSGLGYIMCAAAPYIWTFKMGHTILEATQHGVYWAVLLFGAFCLLPSAKSRKANSKNGGLKALKNGNEIHISTTDLAGLFETGTHVSFGLLKPYMTSLYAMAVLQSFVIPGISRATYRPPVADFETSLVVNKVSLAMGILLGRSSLLSFRIGDLKTLLTVQAIISFVMMVNSVFLFYGGDNLLTLGHALLGVSSGAIYINTYAHALENLTRGSPTQAKTGLPFIASGEVLGLLVGTLSGCAIEWRLCGEPGLATGRWCSPAS